MKDLSIANRYRVLKQLGQGGFGAVYQCQDLQTDLPVAVKLLQLDPKEKNVLARFQREGLLASRIDHPGVVRVLDQGVHDGSQPFLVSELVAGPNLEDYLATEPHRSRVQRNAWLRQLAEALDAIHEAGVIHRDLKPANILVDGDRLRLCDFGLARRPADTIALTATGQLLGTPLYMAPELFKGDLASVPSDLWALGAIGYELYYEETWGGGRDLQEMLSQKQVSVLDPRRFGRFPEADGILQSLLAPNPGKRPGRATEAWTIPRRTAPTGVLDGSVSTVAIAALRTPSEQAPTLSWRRWWLLPGLFLAVASLWLDLPLDQPANAPETTSSTSLPGLDTRRLERSHLALRVDRDLDDSSKDLTYGERMARSSETFLDPAASSRWKRFLREMVATEASRGTRPAPAEWLFTEAHATNRTVSKIFRITRFIEDNPFVSARSNNSSIDLGTWRTRRSEFTAAAAAHLRVVPAGAHQAASEGYLRHLMHLSRLAPRAGAPYALTELLRRLSSPETSNRDLYLELCAALFANEVEGTVVPELIAQALINLQEYLQRKLTRKKPGRGLKLIFPLLRLSAQTLRDRRRVLRSRSVPVFDATLEWVLERSETSPTRVLHQLQNTHVLLDRKTLLGPGEDPELEERRQRIRDLVERFETATDG